MTNPKPKNGLPAIHLGFLRESLEELAMTQAAFADAIGRVGHACVACTERRQACNRRIGIAHKPCTGANSAILAEPANCLRLEVGAN